MAGSGDAASAEATRCQTVGSRSSYISSSCSGIPARTATWATIARSSISDPKRSARALPMGAPAAPNWREMVITGITSVRSHPGHGRVPSGKRVAAARRPAAKKRALAGVKPRHCIDQLAHGSGRLVEGRLLVSGELDLDDLANATAAQLHRNADEQAVDAVLAVEQHGARQDLVAVVEDRIDHLGNARRWRVIGRTGLEQRHHFRAAV